MSDVAVMYVGGMDDARVEAALRRVGYDVSKPVDPALFPARGIALAIVDPEAFGMHGIAATRDAAARLPATRFIALCGPCQRDQLVAMVQIPNLAAIVARDHVGSDAELDRAVRALRGDLPFDLFERVPPKAPRFCAALAKSHDREPVLEQLRDFFRGEGARSRLVDFLVDATEELITNAIYDAPTDSHDERIYAEIDRRHPVFLTAGDRPTVRAAVSGDDALVSVHDPHGSLDPVALRRYLAKGLGGGPRQVDDKRGGAGIGIARVFAMVDRLGVQVEPGVQSEVTLALNLRGARKHMAARPTGLLLVVHG